MATKLQKHGSGADLYERDYYAWTRAHAAALRRMRQQAGTALDLAHLAEEVEDLGRSERDAVRSQVRRIIEHLLQLEYSGAAEPRDGWMDTVADARAVLDDKLSPSLRRDLAAVWSRLYAQVLPKARRALYGFDEGDAAAALPADCPYELDDVCRPEWYPANRHGLAARGAP
jgi:Domain of unknown function DUF29